MTNGREELQNREVRDLVPRPDPTKRTTKQLNRELGHLRGFQDQKLRDLDRLIAQRFRDNSKAIKTALKAASKQQDLLSTQVTALTATVASLAQSRAAVLHSEEDRQTQHNWTVGTVTAAAFSILGLLVSITVAIVLIIHG